MFRKLKELRASGVKLVVSDAHSLPDVRLPDGQGRQAGLWPLKDEELVGASWQRG